MTGEEKLAVAVIERACIDLLNRKSLGRNKEERLRDYMSAKYFLQNLSKVKLPWATLAAEHINILKIERWAKTFP